MASTYSTLKLELIAIGETGSTGNWGTTTNNNLGDTTSTTRGIEQAIGGFSAVTLTTTSTTLAYTNTTANQDFRSLFLSFSGSPGAASTVIIPSTSIQKLYIVKNSISGGYSLTVKYASSTGTVVPNGSTAILYANGTDVIPGQDYIPALTLGSALPVTSGGTGVTTSTGTGSVVLSAAPTLTSPSLSAETFSTSASVTAGTNAQGQGALTSDYNVITTAAANPSGVTLPAATTGRRVVVVNKGANPINVYPATSAYIDGNAINTSIQIIANGVMEFNASSATQWYSSYNLMTPSFVGAVNSFSAGSTGLTPSTATTGNIVLAGTLATSNGGTGLSGATPFTANGAVYASSTSALTTGTLPVASGGTGITSFGTGVATFLGTPSSANLAAAVTDETGTGSLVFATSPSLTTPSLSGETFSTAATVTAGTNAQGQGALTNDYNVITTAASNPSGVTLPTATIGRRIVIVNKGANAVNVYPATGGYIDALAVNTSIQIAINGVMEFNASTTSQWYSSYNLYTSATAAAGVTSFTAGTTGFSPSTATTGAITLSGTLATSNGGTGLSGATPFTANGAVYASSASALTTGTLPTAGGGTGLGGATPFTANGAVYASSTSALTTGTLPIAAGGTNSTATATAGGVSYGTGTAYAFTAAGTSGQVLTSNGSGAPTWATATGGIAYTRVTSNTTLTNNQGVIADTTGGTFTVTLPATPSSGNQVWIADGGSWGTTNLTVGRNGSTIEGTAADLTLDISGVEIQMIYDGTTWQVYVLGGASSTSTTGSGNTVLATSPTITTPTISGNETYTGSGGRILADFDNATVTNRRAFQTSTTDASTGIYALPNGTSTAASWQATNSADPTNCNKILIATNASTDVQLVSGVNGSNSYLPLSFYNNGSQKMQLSTAGNFGIGVTPSNNGWLELAAGTTSVAPARLTSGTNLTSPVAGTIEYDGTRFYGTADTVSGRGYFPTVQIFRLSANGSAITTNANFFGSNSAAVLAVNGSYELEAYCYFTKATAATVSVTLLASTSVFNLNGTVQYGAAAGGLATGAANQISLFASTAATNAFGASASLSAANHAFIIRAVFDGNTLGNNDIRINFAAASGSLTPLRNSYYKVTRLPASNTGNFNA
jgi:hypothetical protein